MDYVDRNPTCLDCVMSLIFRASEQEFFVSKGFVNEPGRCRNCRQAKKQQRRGSDVGLDSYSYRR